MLLRSSSTPILKSCIPQSLAAVDSAQKIPSNSKPISVTAWPINKIHRTTSESNMRQIAIPQRLNLTGSPACFKEQEEEETLVGGGDIGGIQDGGQGFVGDWGREEKQSMDEYYQNMIKIYPGDSLLLANYAKYLKEVKGDLVKAEEYCERAILVRPDDGEVLSMYGDLIWINHRDGARANYYIDRALQASPEDCHVLACRARYLWFDEKEDEEEKEETAKRDGDEQKNEHQVDGNNAITFTPLGHARFSLPTDVFV